MLLSHVFQQDLAETKDVRVTRPQLCAAAVWRRAKAKEVLGRIGAIRGWHGATSQTPRSTRGIAWHNERMCMVPTEAAKLGCAVRLLQDDITRFLVVSDAEYPC